MENVKRTKVVDLLKSTAYGSIVNVKGWVRTHRSSKAVDFIALNDGSTINNIQIVAWIFLFQYSSHHSQRLRGCRSDVPGNNKEPLQP